MKYVHYSPSKVEEFKPYQYNFDEHPQWHKSKPYGLWISIEDTGFEDDINWKEFCERENFNLDNFQHSYEITLQNDSKILFLKSSDEIREFSKSYQWIHEPWKDPIGLGLYSCSEID